MLCIASYDAVLEDGGTLLGFFLDRILSVPLPLEDAEIIRILNAMARY